MIHTTTYARANTQASLSAPISRLVRDNVLRIGLVAAGMTLFIAVAEAKTPIKDVNLADLPNLVSQVANQSTLEGPMRIGSPSVTRQYLSSDDFSATVSPSNVLNSPAARFITQRLN